MTDDNHHWSGLEIPPTAGERLQNWLATRGLSEPVRRRDLMHPEPPYGLWSVVNGTVTLTVLAAFLGVMWLAIFDAIPAIVFAGTH